jgi:DNA-binding IclR family transcriptional regulator
MPLRASPAVLRANELLAELAKTPDGPLTVTELARITGMPRASCHTVLLALMQGGYVARNQDLRYGLGPTCITVGEAARDALTVLREAAIEAERLADDTSSCVAVLVGENGEMRAIEVFDRASPLGLRFRVGLAVPLIAPFGVAFAAWGSESDVQRWLDKPGRRLDREETDRYHDALTAVRQRGFSITVEARRRGELVDVLNALESSPHAEDARRRRDELMEGMMLSEYLPAVLDDEAVVRFSQISAPVFDGRGSVAAVLSLSGVTYDVMGEQVNELGRKIIDATRAATIRTGGTYPS